MNSDELSERLLEFAARIGKVVDALPESRLGRHIAGQLIRCGTSPAPNYEEVCGAESRKDFFTSSESPSKNFEKRVVGFASSSKRNFFRNHESPSYSTNPISSATSSVSPSSRLGKTPPLTSLHAPRNDSSMPIARLGADIHMPDFDTHIQFAF